MISALNTPPPSGAYAIFPGSFDPIHNGHVQIARYMCQHYAFDAIYFIPTDHFVNRAIPMVLSGEWRVRLCKAALETEAQMTVLDHEVTHHTPGYLIKTIDILRHAWNESHPINVIIGNDLLNEMHEWKAFASLVRSAHFYIFNRASAPKSTRMYERLQYTHCNNSIYHISSTEVRTAIKERRSVHALLPGAVARLIQDHRLYA